MMSGLEMTRFIPGTGTAAGLSRFPALENAVFQDPPPQVSFCIGIGRMHYCCTALHSFQGTSRDVADLSDFPGDPWAAYSLCGHEMPDCEPIETPVRRKSTRSPTSLEMFLLYD